MSLAWILLAGLGCAGAPATHECGLPVPFAPGEISVPDRSEYRVAFTPDGGTLFFHVDTTDRPPRQTIHTSRLEGGRWTPAQVVPFSGTWRDSDPFVAPDGTLYFSSTRPVPGTTEARVDNDLWLVRPNGDGWGEPVHLGPGPNSAGEELYPSATTDGTVYFGSDAPGGHGGWDVYRSVRTADGWGPRENLGPAVNSALWEFNPWVSPDESRLLFVGLKRPDGLGWGDVFTSRRVDGRWQPAQNLGPGVNTDGEEFHPTLGPDGWLYFVRQVWEPFTPSDLWRVQARCVGL